MTEINIAVSPDNSHVKEKVEGKTTHKATDTLKKENEVTVDKHEAIRLLPPANGRKDGKENANNTIEPSPLNVKNILDKPKEGTKSKTDEPPK